MGRIQQSIKSLVEERKEDGTITQKRLADILGTSPSVISALLSGDRRLHEDQILKLCDALGVTLADLDRAQERPVEAAELRYAIDLLRHLHRANRDPGFLSISRSIEDWLKTGKAAPAREAKTKPEGSTVAEPSAAVIEFQKPRRLKEPPVIDATNLHHEIDAPREEIYEDLPFYDDFRVPAGKPDVVGSDGTMSVRQVVRHLAKGNRYVIRVKGDSMEPRIQDGDLLLVDYAKEPRPGQTVIALINSEAVVKKYLRQKGRIILRSSNTKYPDIEIKESDQFVIAGVVLRIVEGSV